MRGAMPSLLPRLPVMELKRMEAPAVTFTQNYGCIRISRLWFEVNVMDMWLGDHSLLVVFGDGNV